MLLSAGAALQASSATHQRFGTFAQNIPGAAPAASRKLLTDSIRTARPAPRSHAMYLHDYFKYCTRISYNAAFNILLSSQKINTVVLS